jgi:RNA polymerase sigma factor (sigma-70 family)
VGAIAGNSVCDAGCRAVSSAPKMLPFLSHYVRTGRVHDLEDCLRDSPLARAAINALGRDASTLLGNAARRGDAACCRVLLEHGAVPAGVAGQGRTPLELAEEGGNPEVVGLIQRALRPAPPPPAALPELDFDLTLDFDLGPIQEEAPIVVHAPPPAVWAELRQRSQRHDESAPVEADLELALDDFSFEVPDELRLKGLTQEEAERLRSVVTACLVEARVYRAALVDALDLQGSENEEPQTAKLIDALAARLAQAGAIETDGVWEAADPLVIERPPAPRWELGGPPRRSSPLEGADGLPELYVDPVHDAGVGLPVAEVLAVVDEHSADAEKAWWAKAARTHARPMSEPADVLHARLALAQEQLVVDLGRWLDSLPHHERAAARDDLLAGGDEIDGADAEVAVHADTAHPEPLVDGLPIPSAADDGAELGLEDEPTEGLDGPAAEHTGAHRDGSRAKGRQPPPLGRNTMEAWLPRLRLLDAAAPTGRRLQPPRELLDSAALIRGLMEELTEHHLPLVRDVVKTWRWAPVDAHELIQQGNLGLWRALHTFKPGEAAFGTYARWWIRARITRYIRADGDLHPSPGVAERAGSFAEALDWRRRSQPGAGWTDVATWLELDVESVRRTMDSVALVEGRRSWEELEEADHPPSRDVDPADALAAHADANALRRALVHLGPREQEVVGMRFGLGGGDGARLSEIGVAMNLSRERVRQIETKALDRLRRAMAREVEEPAKPTRRRGTAAQQPDEPSPHGDDPLPVGNPTPLKPVVMTIGTDTAAKSDRQRMDHHGR